MEYNIIIDSNKLVVIYRFVSVSNICLAYSNVRVIFYYSIFQISISFKLTLTGKYRLRKNKIKQPGTMKLPCPLCLIFSFHSISPLLSCATNRPLLFLQFRSATVFKDPSTRDARENNLESTLVVTATAATVAVATTTTTTTLPNQPPTLTHADRRCLSTRFSTFFLLPRPLYELSGPKLWPARETVNYRQRRRESTGGGLLVTFAGPFRRKSSTDFRLLMSVALSAVSLSSSLVRITSPWNRAIIKRPSTYGQFAISSSRSK